MANLFNVGRGLLEKLPYDAEIEYLEKNDKTYKARIETDVAFAAGDIPTVKIGCMLRQKGAAFDSIAYGGYTLNPNVQFSISFGSRNNMLTLKINNGTVYSQEYNIYNYTLYDIIFNDYNGSFINGQQVDANVYQLNNSLNSLPLFTSKPNEYGKEKEVFRGRIYYFQLLVNGVMRRDFIPVRVGNVGYMYDKVSGQLFGNSGTGDFILGPDK